VGHRMKIAHTRALVNAALEGRLDNIQFKRDPVFGLEVPVSAPEVPPEILTPRNTWADKTAYDAKAKELINRFAENFKQFKQDVPLEVQNAGPKSENYIG